MYVICGRNVALAVFADWTSAWRSVQAEGYRLVDGDCNEDYSEWTDGADVLTIVHLTQSRPIQGAAPLFRMTESNMPAITLYDVPYSHN